MKVRWTLVLFLMIGFFLQVAVSQELIETRTATLVDGDYTLQGTVHLELFDDETLNLRFEDDYMTQSNVFDVHVFLTNDNDYSNPIDTTGLLLVENIGTLTGLNYSSGPMTFNLPAGVGINDYQHIVFICVRFGQLHWGDGEFSESSVITNTTELDGLERLAVDIYPNPSGTDLVNVKLENPQTNTLLEVMSLEGKVVLREYIVGIQPYSVELKDPGTYFFKLTSDVSSVVRKIIRL